MASFLGSIFGFEFGAKNLFWRLWQVIPDWLVLDATGCEQSELLLLSSISGSFALKQIPCHRLLHDGVSMRWHMLPSRLQDDAALCQHDTEKTVYDLRFWHDDAWRESRASLVEEWNFMLDIRLGCASICKRVVGHIHWEFFFGAATFLFVLDSLCLFWQRPFLVSISGRPLLLFH